MESKSDHNQIMYMLGEMRSDIKTLVKSQEDIVKFTSTQSDRIDVLEKGEVARVSRAGVMGALVGLVGALVVGTGWDWIKIKLNIL